MSTKVNIKLKGMVGKTMIPKIGEFYLVDGNKISQVVQVMSPEGETLAVLNELSDGVPWDDTPCRLEDLLEQVSGFTCQLIPEIKIEIQ